MPEKKKKSLWQTLRERLNSIGEMADAIGKRTKKKKPRVDTGRVSRKPVRPQPNPQQQAAIDAAQKED
jgi:hypothetical protein